MPFIDSSLVNPLHTNFIALICCMSIRMKPEGIYSTPWNRDKTDSWYRTASISMTGQAIGLLPNAHW